MSTRSGTPYQVSTVNDFGAVQAYNIKHTPGTFTTVWTRTPPAAAAYGRSNAVSAQGGQGPPR